MDHFSITRESDFYHKLKWLMLARVFFALIMLTTSLIIQPAESKPLEKPFVILYTLSLSVFVVSLIYAAIFRYIRKGILFAYLQVIIDTFFVSFIIIITGISSNIFAFLYMVVIIYSSILLFRRGSFIVAAICSIQYGAIADLEYYGFLNPFFLDHIYLSTPQDWHHVLYRIISTMLACFAVAFLSSLLSERTRTTETELLAMENHVRRVAKLASLGEMAAGLAHEIKNPLASLSGSIQLLKQDTDSGTADNRLMQIILRESERLNALVSEFLLFAKPSQDNIEIIQLDHELAEIITLFKNDSSCRNRIDLTTELVPDFKIAMDPAQLRQVLWNVLLNAADAIEKQGHIIIKMYPLQRRHVCITITDDGCGMSHKTVKKIFDPFFTTKASGTGLGLSIVHSILQSYNGWLGVYSQLDKGTTFTLNLRRLI